MSIIVNRNITFIDSNGFCKGALDTLASDLEDNYFKYLKSEFADHKLEILKRKDAYSYEWVDSYEKLNYPQLLPKKCFNSSLKDGKRDRSDENIPHEQYLHEKNIWNTFNFNKFEDFFNNYWKKDVLLLSDVLEKVIPTSLKYYNLDPCHYFSAPGLSWDAMLKMTKIELEKIRNPDKYIFIEKGMRGGISYINKRCSKANNEYCADYDSKKPKKQITYLDMNNLYGYAMSQYLPHANFKWIKNINEIEQKLMRIKRNSLTGYIYQEQIQSTQQITFRTQ